MREEGAILFPVLSVCLTTAVISTTLVMVAQMNAQIVRARTAHDEAYWMARGTVMSALQEMKHGEKPSEQTDVSLPSGRLHVDVHYNATWTIQVVATTPRATVQVSAAVDPKTLMIVGWQESAPLSTGS